MQKLKVNDEVLVIAGKDKGKTGKIARLDFKNSKVIVKGINLVKKAIKPTKESPNGGIIEKENAISVSNVALMSPKTKKQTRVRFEVKDGKKVRVATACKSVI